MIIDRNATTFFVQQQIHEIGKHPIYISRFSTEKKGLEHEYEPNLYKTYNPKQNSGKLSAIYSASSLLHSDLYWMKDVVKSEYFLHMLCLQYKSFKLYTADIFTLLSISFY